MEFRAAFLMCCIVGITRCGIAAERAVPDFTRDVQPLLAEHCLKCHGPSKQQGGLRFDRRAGALKAGDSGVAAIVPGRANASELIRRLEAADASERMPPDAPPLVRAQIEKLRAWIDAGADWPASADAAGSNSTEMIVTDEDRQHWAYLPLAVTPLPDVHDAAWCRTPIDRFILASLENLGIHPNSSADRKTLIRRLSFDLVGLPPEADEVEAFLRDSSPDAYERLVDRLLASPHHGERWGRHWLDLARYADSDGLETDLDRPSAYHYRDFVIRALNEDFSYQTFVRWQLAGDEYEPDRPLALAATGFLTGAPCEKLTDMHLEEERLRLRYNELDDMAATTASAFLALTLGCARCHDHKFDAIPARDYYRIQAAFTTTARDDVLLAPRDVAARFRGREQQWQKRLNAAQDKLDQWLSEQKKPVEPTLREAKIAALPIADEKKQLLKEQPDSEAARKLAAQHKRALTVSDADFRAVFSKEQRQTWDALKRDVAAVQRERPPSPPTALAIRDLAREPKPTWLLARGDFYARQEAVSLGFLSVLTRDRPPEDYLAAAHRDAEASETTLQRRALADWMTDLEQGAGATLARVMVNRLWQHHLGAGLSRTANDFGLRGERPSHPELLEWLSTELTSGGWHLKRMHRLVVTSSAYRQGTTFDPHRAAQDPDNRLLWRRRPLRLEAEIIRDYVLAVSGTLNGAMFGPAFKPPIPPEAIVARNTKSPYPQDAKDTHATRRRSVYMFHKRVTPHPLLQVFDAPDATLSCGQRNATTVAPQALALLNDTFMRDRAVDFARRLAPDAKKSNEEVVHEAFQVAFGRAPSGTELAASVDFLRTQSERRAARTPELSKAEIHHEALADFCQTLFSLNEFVYVD